MSKISTVHRRRNLPADVKPKFTNETLEKLADDLQKKRVPLDRVTISDEMQVGLRAIIRNTGGITFHASYDIGGGRPYLKLGTYPEMTIKEARELTKTVRYLADMGIDPQEGLHDRLVRQLKEKGTRWRP